MQDYYQQNVFGNGYSNVALQLSFVGTICLILSNCMGPFAQILQSYIGTRGVLFIGTIFIALGLIIAGFAHEVTYQTTRREKGWERLIPCPFTDLAFVLDSRFDVWCGRVVYVCGK